MSYPYPPPPSPGPSRQTPLWIAIGLTAGLAVVALVVGVVATVRAFTSFDPYDFSGDEMFGEDEYYAEVGESVREPCDRLSAAAADVRLFGGAQSGARQLGAVADAARAVADAVADDSDGDADLLAADWRFVADEVENYASAVAAGRSPDASFVDDGTWVPDRIYYGNDVCFAPGLIAALDPEGAEEMMTSLAY